jgi:hypothetical protein
VPGALEYLLLSLIGSQGDMAYDLPRSVSKISRGGKNHTASPVAELVVQEIPILQIGFTRLQTDNPKRKCLFKPALQRTYHLANCTPPIPHGDQKYIPFTEFFCHELLPLLEYGYVYFLISIIAKKTSAAPRRGSSNVKLVTESLQTLERAINELGAFGVPLIRRAATFSMDIHLYIGCSIQE